MFTVSINMENNRLCWKTFLFTDARLKQHKPAGGGLFKIICPETTRFQTFPLRDLSGQTVRGKDPVNIRRGRLQNEPGCRAGPQLPAHKHSNESH